jgi:hypothetical protein
MQQGFNPNQGRPNWRQDPFGVQAPMGNFGNNEMLRPGKDSLETHVRARHDEKSSYLLMIIRQIGGGCQVIEDFVKNMDVASQPIDGWARIEQIMLSTGMIAPDSLPYGLGRKRPNNGDKHSVWNRSRQRTDENE